LALASIALLFIAGPRLRIGQGGVINAPIFTSSAFASISLGFLAMFTIR
jgi:hypothetical protein